MNAEITALQGRISQARKEIAELEKDRAGLQGFLEQVSKDRQGFSDTLHNKRDGVSRLAAIGNSNSAVRISEMLSARYDGTFEANVLGCFDGTKQETNRAIRTIDEKIAQLNARISSYETQIEDARRRERLEEERRRVAAMKGGA